MPQPDTHTFDETERLVERLLHCDAPAARDGLTWDDIAHLAQDITGARVDDVALLGALALTADARRPVPVDVAERHLATMHAAVGELTQAPAPAARGSRMLNWRRRFAGAAAAATAFTTLGGGAAVAVAQEAVPGDALYGVKRASEQVRLVLEPSKAGDAALHLSFAERRLRELAAAPESADALVIDALDSLAVAEQDGDEATREQAATVGQGAIDALTALLDGKLPENASPRAREALQRNLDRKTAQQEAKESGATGKDQAPGQQGKDTDKGDAPGRPDDTPGRSGDAPGQTKSKTKTADG